MWAGRYGFTRRRSRNASTKAGGPLSQSCLKVKKMRVEGALFVFKDKLPDAR